MSDEMTDAEFVRGKKIQLGFGCSSSVITDHNDRLEAIAQRLETNDDARLHIREIVAQAKSDIWAQRNLMYSGDAAPSDVAFALEDVCAFLGGIEPFLQDEPPTSGGRDAARSREETMKDPLLNTWQRLCKEGGEGEG